MSYYESHRNLSFFFAGYLNQDWKEIYIWEGREPNYPPIVRKLKTELSNEELEETIKQLKEIMSLNVDFDDDDGDGADILTWDMGLAYYPPGGNGITYREWLKDVLKILEEPMEKTKQEFIPERI